MRRRIAYSLALALLGLMVLSPMVRADQLTHDSQTLRVLTINVWFGLDYKGILRFGDLETPDHREARYHALVAQTRALDPDVVFLQEAYPAGGFSARLARDLGYSATHQVCLGGVKFGPLGIPTDFKEGNAVLARKNLRLEKLEDWKLSGSFGLFGDVLTVHFNEAIFAELARIFIGDVPVLLVNTHLFSVPPDDSELAQAWEAARRREGWSEEGSSAARDEWRRGLQRQSMEMKRLASHLRLLPHSVPLIVGGDFNAPPSSAGLQALQDAAKLHDAFQEDSTRARFTWDASRNENVSASIEPADHSSALSGAFDQLAALNDSVPRRIDHIFVGGPLSEADVRSGRVVLDEKVNGVQASDHFGVVADIDLRRAMVQAPREPSTVVNLRRTTIEPFPLLNYDSDTGVGYGVKLFLLNALRTNESFDLIAFHTTKGESWYRLAFFRPDRESRQGKIYPCAVDLLAEYDKNIGCSFFGIGNNSSYASREKYTREPLDFSLALSRGFTRRIVGQVGARFSTVRNFHFAADSRLHDLPPTRNAGRVDYSSVSTVWRWDSRDSFVNPSHGLVVQGEFESAPRSMPGNTVFERAAAWVQHYSVLFYPRTVLAVRLGAQRLFGHDLPVQVLLPIGGSGSLRGSSQNRFLDKAAVVGNAELRFPVFRRVSGMFGWDVAQVGPTVSKLSPRGWRSNPAVGLRLSRGSILVRVDVGLGKETTGLYLNFGQLF